MYITFEYEFITEKTNKRIKQYLQKGANISEAVAHSFNHVYLLWEHTEVLVNMISEEINKKISRMVYLRL